MKIAVIGANGQAGKAFVNAALAAGHQVTAGVHSHNSLPDDKHLIVTTCDATKLEDIKELVAGQDAVVSLLGHGYKRLGNIQTQAMQNLIQVMTSKQKLVSLTGSGVRRPDDKIPLYDQLLNVPLKLIFGDMVNDGIGHIKVLEDSQLDWTVVRALVLTNGKVSSFHLLEHGPPRLLTARATVAQAILQILHDQSFRRKAPIIGN